MAPHLPNSANAIFCHFLAKKKIAKYFFSSGWTDSENYHHFFSAEPISRGRFYKTLLIRNYICIVTPSSLNKPLDGGTHPEKKWLTLLIK